jgi:MoaA/NifB/PqqE/SkfB family radical SAM enzyme
VVVSRVNADEIYGICALAVELGIRYVILSPIYANGPLGFLCLQPEDEVRLKLQFERLETDFPGKITVISGILPGNLTGHAEKTNATKSALLTRLKQTRYGEPVSLQTLPEILQSLPALADFSWWPHPPAKPEISNPPAYELATATARDMQLAQRLLASSRIKFPYCLAPWIIAYVHAQGTVRPCCFYPRTLDESLHDKPLAEIWNSPAFRDLRAAMLGWHELPAACRACEASMRQVYKNPLIDFAGQYGFQHSKTEDVLEFKPQVFFTP